MKKIIVILIAVLIDYGVVCFGQGKVTRPSKQQTQTDSQTSKTSTQKVSSPKVSEPDGFINGHGYVDLGLPSGLKWATCNIGAQAPEEYGSYFAWGEITSKSSYSKENCLTSSKTVAKLQSEGVINMQGILNIKYDAANANWGGSWRMPTKSEFDELVEKCKWKWISMDGKKGYKVTGPNGNSIFLSAAGDRFNSSLNGIGEDGHYWSGSARNSYDNSYYLFFYGGGLDSGENFRFRGRSVRAVSE